MQLTVRLNVFVVLAMVVGLLGPTQRAEAGSKDPATILAQCIDEMGVAANVAADEMDAIAAEADEEIEALYFDSVPISRLFRAAAGFVSRVEKVESKAQSKLTKIANKYRARLQRVGADQSFIDDLDSALDDDSEVVGLAFFQSVTSIEGSLEDWVFPL